MSVEQPRLVVFDLDFTLWDCGGTWCDCLSPPFRFEGDRIVDRNGRHVRLYEDVRNILDQCDRDGLEIALASRTEQPQWARQLVEMLDIAHRFAHAEIYPSSKLAHFAKLREASGVSYDQMLFFDDEMRNIREVSTLGVTSVYVESGMSLDLFGSGLTKHADKDLR